MKKARALRACALAATLLANGLAVSAQEKDKDKERVVVRDVVVQDDVLVATPGERVRHPAPVTEGGYVFSAGSGGDNFVFVSAEMSFDGKIVKGAPYSAQAVTETTHTLADGNRIVRRNTATVYRDSEGRTRRDQTLGAIGPFATQGEPPMTFFINDPVAGVHYILDPRTKTARKIPAMHFSFERAPAPPGARFRGTGAGVGQSGSVRVQTQTQTQTQMKSDESADAPRRRARSAGYTFSTAVPPPMGAPDVMFYSHGGEEPKVEKLGRQSVEGVEAEGERVTTTIPAGAIGNERAIEVVSERWFSPELQTVVMTRHSDPRFGETVYRLTNVTRTEPARTLFEVPSDYTLREGLKPNVRTYNKKLQEGAPPPQEN